MVEKAELMEFDHTEKNTAEYIDEMADLLTKEYGPLLCGDELAHLLGFSSQSAMRSAVQRKSVSVVVMKFPHRRKKFGLVEEVVWWLISQRINNCDQSLNLYREYLGAMPYPLKAKYLHQ
ncbi:MAG: hypothetical protein MI867_06635 [Pseudomonadales bacterium]|nr:hypothetical protein [Pseudomonadales bacterium]